MIALSSYSPAFANEARGVDSVASWKKRINAAMELKYLVSTKQDVIKSFGPSDLYEPNTLPRGVIQYVYNGKDPLPTGIHSAIRFRFNNENKLIGKMK